LHTSRRHRHFRLAHWMARRSGRATPSSLPHFGHTNQVPSGHRERRRYSDAAASSGNRRPNSGIVRGKSGRAIGRSGYAGVGGVVNPVPMVDAATPRARTSRNSGKTRASGGFYFQVYSRMVPSAHPTNKTARPSGLHATSVQVTPVSSNSIARAVSISVGDPMTILPVFPKVPAPSGTGERCSSTT
jgi:hypothetical protein